MARVITTTFRCDATDCDYKIEIEERSGDTPLQAAERTAHPGPYVREAYLKGLKQQPLFKAWLCERCADSLGAQIKAVAEKFVAPNIQF